MNIIEDDGHDDARIIHHNKADDADGGANHESCQLVNHHHNKEVQQEKMEPPFKSTLNQSSVVEVAKVSYLGFFIKVYTDVNSRGRRRFYHDPIVLLDRSSIVSESNELLKQDLVRFKIKMWGADIRSKIINRLRSLPSLMDVEIHEDDVHVMPYEEVKLVAKPGSILKSIRLADEATSYLQLNESLDYDFECDLPSVADTLAENLRKNPELIVKKWKLALECRGLALDSGAESSETTSRKCPTWLFNVSTAVESDTTNQESMIDDFLLRLEGYDNEIQDLKATILSANRLSNEASSKLRDFQDVIEAINEKKPTTSIPVFSVENCTNPAAGSGQSFGFSTPVMNLKTEHGNFDLLSGVFTVKTRGTYLLNFNAHVQLTSGSSDHRFDLKINGKTVAVSYNQSSVGTSGWQPVVLMALVPLKTGDKVGIFSFCGKLYESTDWKTRFHGILLMD